MISPDGSAVTVRVIPTDEGISIAREALAAVAALPEGMLGKEGEAGVGW